MSKLVELKSDDGKSFYVESTDVEESEIKQASGHLEKKFEKILDTIRPFSDAIVENFRQLQTKPDSATAEFGISVSAEGNIFVVKASGEASVKITLNWNSLKNN